MDVNGQSVAQASQLAWAKDNNNVGAYSQQLRLLEPFLWFSQMFKQWSLSIIVFRLACVK